MSILDKDNKLIAHLCDNPDPGKRAKNGIPKDQWADGEFLSPHSVCWDDQGNLYFAARKKDIIRLKRDQRSGNYVVTGFGQQG